MARIEITATLVNDYAFDAPKYAGYGYETRHIYTLDADGKIYVWKTTSVIGLETDDGFDPINRGDVIRLKATVKGESEYKGQPQTVLSRVSVLERTFRAKTREEIAAEEEALREAKKAAQLASLKGGDFVWKCMPYKQYKERYADCEVVVGSFFRPYEDCGPSYVDVIIRDGRLKASGVRGRHYSGYEFFFVEDGKRQRECYYAISEETAMRRLCKEHPGATDITYGDIYQYGF